MLPQTNDYLTSPLSVFPGGPAVAASSKLTPLSSDTRPRHVAAIRDRSGGFTRDSLPDGRGRRGPADIVLTVFTNVQNFPIQVFSIRP
jgi:hypothetical protein